MTKHITFYNSHNFYSHAGNCLILWLENFHKLELQQLRLSRRHCFKKYLNNYKYCEFKYLKCLCHYIKELRMFLVLYRAWTLRWSKLLAITWNIPESDLILNPASEPVTLDDYYTSWSDWSDCDLQQNRTRTRGCKDDSDCPRLSHHMTEVTSCSYPTSHQGEFYWTSS